jgi:site-specific DNA-methyltransferase (adenine-specific)
LSQNLDGLVEAFKNAYHGFSVDRVVADPILNEDFQIQCDRKSVPGTAAERNRFLFRVRKSGKLKSHDIRATVATKIDWPHVRSFLFASEIAWRQMSDKYCISLDEIFCDPRLAENFDQIAASFAPGYQSLDYRWGALKLRKEGSNAKRRASMQTPEELGITDLKKKHLKKRNGHAQVASLDFSKVPSSPGVYIVREPGGKALYASETLHLASHIETAFSEEGPRNRWLERSHDLELFWLKLPSIDPSHRFARHSWLLNWHRPSWNSVKEFAYANESA